MKYDLINNLEVHIKNLEVHIKKTKKNYGPPGWGMFSSPAGAETEVLFF